MNNYITILIFFLCYNSTASEFCGTSFSRSPGISPRMLHAPHKDQNQPVDIIGHPSLVRVKKQSKEALFEDQVQMKNFLDLLNKKKKNVNNE